MTWVILALACGAFLIAGMVDHAKSRHWRFDPSYPGAWRPCGCQIGGDHS
jgi:hypothetical protein